MKTDLKKESLKINNKKLSSTAKAQLCMESETHSSQTATSTLTHLDRRFAEALFTWWLVGLFTVKERDVIHSNSVVSSTSDSLCWFIYATEPNLRRQMITHAFNRSVPPKTKKIHLCTVHIWTNIR